jgi:uncharacterized protein (TIGR03435 family)
MNRSETRGMSVLTLPGGGFRARNAPLKVLIRRAYAVQSYQVVDGPAWLDSARFDVEAKMDKATVSDPFQSLLMLRTLLADRFQLRVRAESRDLQIYELIKVRSDSKTKKNLRPSDLDCVSPGAVPISESDVCNVHMGLGPNGNTMKARGVTMARLAEYLQPYVRRMIVDKTGLSGSGTFDIELDFWTDPALLGLPTPPGPPIDTNSSAIFEAVQQQLGLRLHQKMGPVEVLVVEHVEQPNSQ